MKKLSIIIPVYFNEKSLPILYKKIQEIEGQLNSLKIQIELIFIDDGSGDNSLDELLKIKNDRPATKIIKLTRNFGAVHASKTGFQFVTGDCFTIMAADLQDPPGLLLEMVKKWLDGSKFIICERISRRDPWHSKLLSSIYYKLLKLFVIKDYPKGGFDIMLMDKALLTHLQQSSKTLYTPLLAYWLGYKPEVIHYHRPERIHGKSGWTFSKKFKAYLDVMLGFSVTPIRFMSAIGAGVASLSFLYGLWIFVNALLGRVDGQGFASLVVLITFLLGLIILMLGIIGEYLWRIFDELNKRPEVVIDEIY